MVDDPAAGNRVITQTGGTGDGTLFDIWCESTLGTSTFTPDLDHAKVTVAYAGGDDAFCQFVHLGGGGG